MGSRITRPIYRSERNVQPSAPTIIEFICYFSALLALLALFSVGYSRQIDRQLIRIMSPHYQLEKQFATLESILMVVSPLVFGVLLSMFSHVAIIMKCSFLFLISQMLSYFAFSKLGLGALYVGEVMLDIYSPGLLLCVLCMLFKQSSTKLEYYVSGAIMLAALNVGSHWSNMLTVRAHDVSIQNVYFNSTLFATMASMAVFILVHFQKRLRYPTKTSHELDRRNWNFQSLWLIGKIRIRTFLHTHLSTHLLLLVGGFVIGMLQERLTASQQHELLPNIFLWAGIVIAVFGVGNLQQQWILVAMLPLTMVLLIAVGAIFGKLQLFVLAAYHCSEIAHIMSVGRINTPIYFVNWPIIQSVSLGAYYAAYSLGVAAQFSFLKQLPELYFAVAALLITITTSLHSYHVANQAVVSKHSEQEHTQLTSSQQP